MSEKWSLAGTFVEACNCDVACPCIFGGSPTTGECKAFVGWHIDKGNYGDVALDGLNVALAVYTPGDMDKTEWKVALYYDDKASEAQNNALTQIFTGQAGGWLAGLAEAWKPGSGELLGAKSVGIEYYAEGKRRSLKIADVVESEIEAITGVDDKDVILVNAHPASAPEFALTVAKSKKLSYHDYGWQWEISEKSGFFTPFVYQGN
jgi:hypothetical protein